MKHLSSNRAALCILAALAIAAALASCGPEEPDNNDPGSETPAPKPEPEPGKKATVTLEFTEKTVSDGAQTLSVGVTASGEWSVSAEKGGDWCSASRASATSASISIAKNETYDGRSALFKFSCGEATAYLTINQAQKDALILSEKSFSIDPDGGSFCVEVRSNVPVVCEVLDGWIAEISTRTMETTRYEFSTGAWSDSEERSGHIVFKAGDNLQETVTVTQKSTSSLTITRSEFSVSAEKSVITVEMRSVADVRCRPDVDWIKEVPATRNPVSDNRIQFIIEENDRYEARIGHIELEAEGRRETITVNQDQCRRPYVTLDFTEKTISDGAQTLSVGVMSYGEWNVAVEKGGDWCSVSKTSATSASISVAKNETYDGRSAMFRFSCGDATAYLTINQAQKDALILSEKAFSIDPDGGSFCVEVRSNVDVSCEICDGWIKALATRALETTLYEFSIEEWSDTEERSGRIVFRGGKELEEVVTVTQKSTSALTITRSEFSVSAEKSVITVEMRSVADVKCTPDVDWIKEVPATRSTVSDNRIQFIIEENGSYGARVGHIELEAEGRKETITVNQAQNDEVLVNDSQISVGAGKSLIRIPVMSNVDFSCEISADWITRVETRALEETVTSFQVSENFDNKARTGEIRMKYGDIVRTVKVEQEGFEFSAAVPVTSFPYTKSSISLSLKSNVKTAPWRASADAEWLSLDAYEGEGDAEIVLTADENYGPADRTATLVLTVAGHETRIELHQEAKPDLTQTTTPGVYALTDGIPEARLVLRLDADEFVLCKLGDKRSFRIQNYDEEFVCDFRFPATIEEKQNIVLTVQTFGKASLSTGDKTVTVEKMADGMIWLIDYNENLGYILAYR